LRKNWDFEENVDFMEISEICEKNRDFSAKISDFLMDIYSLQKLILKNFSDSVRLNSFLIYKLLFCVFTNFLICHFRYQNKQTKLKNPSS
jgi:hypothetical protein